VVVGKTLLRCLKWQAAVFDSVRTSLTKTAQQKNLAMRNAEQKHERLNGK